MIHIRTSCYVFRIQGGTSVPNKWGGMKNSLWHNLHRTALLSRLPSHRFRNVSSPSSAELGEAASTLSSVTLVVATLKLLAQVLLLSCIAAIRVPETRALTSVSVLSRVSMSNCDIFVLRRCDFLYVC